jgi:hypothetical protein
MGEGASDALAAAPHQATAPAAADASAIPMDRRLGLGPSGPSLAPVNTYRYRITRHMTRRAVTRYVRGNPGVVRGAVGNGQRP